MRPVLLAALQPPRAPPPVAANPVDAVAVGPIGADDGGGVGGAARTVVVLVPVLVGVVGLVVVVVVGQLGAGILGAMVIRLVHPESENKIS